MAARECFEIAGVPGQPGQAQKRRTAIRAACEIAIVQADIVCRPQILIGVVRAHDGPSRVRLAHVQFPLPALRICNF